MAYTFNTDLLLGERDRKEARQQYPNIYFALDNPLVREAFNPYDARANLSKTRSRRWGRIRSLSCYRRSFTGGGRDALS